MSCSGYCLTFLNHSKNFGSQVVECNFSYSSYKEIPSGTGDIDKFETAMRKAAGVVILDDRMFAKAGQEDQFNMATLDKLTGTRDQIPQIIKGEGENQSRDFRKTRKRVSRHRRANEKAARNDR